MTKFKSKKRAIIIFIVVAVFILSGYIVLIGINTPFLKYRDIAVSFLTPDLTWGSKPSDIILKYGSPESIDEEDEITGERTHHFNFVYDEKDISLSAYNRGFENSEIHRYSFKIDCKTPEEAENYFEECHKKIMELYKDIPNFEFKGTDIETDYIYTDGSFCSYECTYENGVKKVLITDDNGNEIPVEEVENVIDIKTISNSYGIENTTGISYFLDYSEGDTYLSLYIDIRY